jgi:hypothetical protein
VEGDRERFVELFTDPSFMVFAGVPSRRVADKLGFRFWRRTLIDGDDVDVLRRWVGPSLSR